jgi:HD superfamily phosphohydrolase
LRGVGQLGPAFVCFPSAIHNRFKHSLGTSDKVREWMHHLRSEGENARVLFDHHNRTGGCSRDYLECLRARKVTITEEDIFHVEVAGLCHDLGHGPFSHCFESLLASVGIKDWHHEDISCLLLRRINDRTHLLSDYGLERVIAMIKGKVLETDKAFLYEIVNNKRNALDADKLDYLKRLLLHRGAHVL